MGNENKTKWKSEMITKECVEETITNVNNITINTLFIQTMNIKLKFSLNYTRVNAPFVTNIIRVELYLPNNNKHTNNNNNNNNNNNTQLSKTPNKVVHVSLTDFISFSDNLNGCKRLFCDTKLFKKMKDSYNKQQQSDTTPTNNSDNICPICDERKVEIMLDCKHLFCEQCIKTWLFDKNNSCPMCRFEINITNTNAEMFAKEQWCVVDNANINDMCSSNSNNNNNKSTFDSIEFYIHKWFR